MLLSEPFSLPLRTETSYRSVIKEFAKLVKCPEQGAEMETCLRALTTDQVLQAQVGGWVV